MPNWTAITRDTRNMVRGWVEKAPPGTLIAFSKPDQRSLEQNALLWRWLNRIAKATDWHGEKLSAEDWKDLFTAALRSSRVVPGLEGGVVVLGLRTSKMKTAEFTALLDLIQAFAAQKEIRLEDDYEP